MTDVDLARFGLAELDGETLRLTGTDGEGAPVHISMDLAQYAALLTDVGVAIVKAQSTGRASGDLREYAVIQATDVRLGLDRLRNDPVLFFRHGQGRQSAFLVPAEKARVLAQLLLSQIESVPHASQAWN